jgi:hypothetical protein
MPYRGSFGVAMALHVLTAVFVIGPLGVATLTAPMLLRAKRTGIGADADAGVACNALPAVRVAVRSIRWLTLASVSSRGSGLQS